MLNIKRALRQDRLLRALTGLNRKAFQSLLSVFTQIYEEILRDKPRQRCVWRGRKARLRTIDRSQAYHWAHRLQPVLEATLEEEKVLPERKINSVQGFIESFPGVERVVIDGTERPVQRPTDSEKQKLNYSGKKSVSKRKHLAAVDQNKQVLLLSKAREGKLHDLKLLDQEKLIGNIPVEIPIEVMSGFQGIQH